MCYPEKHLTQQESSTTITTTFNLTFYNIIISREYYGETLFFCVSP